MMPELDMLVTRTQRVLRLASITLVVIAIICGMGLNSGPKEPTSVPVALFFMGAAAVLVLMFTLQLDRVLQQFQDEISIRHTRKFDNAGTVPSPPVVREVKLRSATQVGWRGMNQNWSETPVIVRDWSGGGGITQQDIDDAGSPAIRPTIPPGRPGGAQAMPPSYSPRRDE